jgi:hypothetical protein
MSTVNERIAEMHAFDNTCQVKGCFYCNFHHNPLACKNNRGPAAYV